MKQACINRSNQINEDSVEQMKSHLTSEYQTIVGWGCLRTRISYCRRTHLKMHPNELRLKKPDDKNVLRTTVLQDEEDGYSTLFTGLNAKGSLLQER